MTNATVKIFTLIGFLLTITLPLSAREHPQVMNEAKIQQLDRRLTVHQARHRNFNTKREYKRHRKHFEAGYHRVMHIKPYRYDQHRTDDYRYPQHEERYDNTPGAYPAEYGRAHQHFKRGWLLAYRYDRAAFYDRDGFYYGYFNRYGYYFEGVFYRYDRFYTYRDRIRGRGLFDRYFYRPAAYRHYGFCR